MLAPTELSHQPTGLDRPRDLRELFACFNAMSLQGFGGLLAVAQRQLCEERRWVGRAQYVELLSVGQVLPGPPIVNVALIVGNQFFGWRGAAVALGGLFTVPLAIVLTLTLVYARFASAPAVAGALRGMGAASAGLILGTALRLVGQLRRSPLGVPACLLVGAATFALVALLRLPLAWVLFSLGAAACGYAARRLRRAGGAEADR